MSALTSLHKASETSGIPYRTLLRLVREGKIALVKIEGRDRPLVDPADVKSFIEKSKIAPESGAESGAQSSTRSSQTLHVPTHNFPRQKRQKKLRGPRNGFTSKDFERGA